MKLSTVRIQKAIYLTLPLLVVVFVAIPWVSKSQTMNSTGNWHDASKWASGNIGDQVTETVTIGTNVSPTIVSGRTYTVGNTTLSNNNTLTINSGGTLNVGNAANSRNLTTNNNANISVAGTLIIWGDLVVNNNLVWNISGTVIVKGNVILKNNSNINVSGNLTIDGNFTGTNNNNVSVSGSVTVGGNVNIGNGSNLNGCGGCFHLGGGCSGPPSFCNSGALPIVLIAFHAHTLEESVSLNWSTASENNFDKFIIEHSTNGVVFDSIGFVTGSGNSKQILSYSFTHSNPILGKNYYRLKSVDVDLRFEYSPLVIAEFKGEKAVVIYPNPATGSLIAVRTNFSPKEGDEIHIYDNMGLKLLEFNIDQYNGFLDINTLKQGSYLLKYISSDYSAIIRFNRIRTDD